MKVLVTGAKGFVGKNLIASLENIRDGKDRTHRLGALKDGEGLQIAPYDIGSDPAILEDACSDCSFVFHLAGVNRPGDSKDYMPGNLGPASVLLDTLKRHRNTCPVMFASSAQASLIGRFRGSAYGESKLAAEGLFFNHARETGAKALVYRFPNIFGKWCRPGYNSAVATFCHSIANGLPATANDPGMELELVYIDDLVEEMLDALDGTEHRCRFDGMDAFADGDGKYCYVPHAHKVTLGEIISLLESFKGGQGPLAIPEIPEGSFAKKLYSTYLSYMPERETSHPLKMNMDDRGSFTELLRTQECGQVSVNVNKPGMAKGQHWHHSKAEICVVVSGHGLIQERKVGRDGNGEPYPVLEFEVSAEKMEAVYMLPGYTHNIINLSDTHDLVTVVWANELFDPGRPDTFGEPV